MSDPNKAKQTLEAFIPLIDTRLNKYWDLEIASIFGYNQKHKDLVQEILFHAKEHNLRPAKRLRGSFVYYGYLLGNQPADDRIWNAAMSVELVHTALLIHDDFMDQDDVRRGKPTTHIHFHRNNEHYGNSMAVTVGDAVLCIGFELLLKSGFDGVVMHQAMSKLLRDITLTTFGQAYDVTLGHLRNEWKEDDIITLHKAKTSIYTYENPLFIGALLGNAPFATFPILHDYAMKGGVAFQMQDDVLGLFGDSEKTGKSTNSDLLQGKCTLLIVKALENGTPKQIEAIDKVWGKRFATTIDLDNAKQAIIDSGSLEYSIQLSKEYARSAAQIAEKLKSLDVNSEAVDYIVGIAQYMVERNL